MMILATSKSVCEVNSQQFDGSDEIDRSGRGRRPDLIQHSVSVSMLDSIPKAIVFTKSNHSVEDDDDNDSNSNRTLSKSSISNVSSVVSFSDFFNQSFSRYEENSN